MQTRLADPTELIAGRYRYVRELGQGTTGRVWLVEDTAPAPASVPQGQGHGHGHEHERGDAAGASVMRALKWVDDTHADRVRSEFALLSRIAHPSLAAVHDLVRVVAQDIGTRPVSAGWGIVSDFVPGERLDVAALGCAGRRDELLALCVRVLHGVARALAELHGRGFVHGDIKPDNVLVDAEASSVTLIDLGLARPPGWDAGLCGTPRFMAPELFRGEVTPAADIYALGLMLRSSLEPELRSGPVEAEPSLLLARALQPLAAPAGWVPPPLAALLTRMCAVEMTSRPASAAELLDLLGDLTRVLPQTLSTAAAKRGRKRARSPSARAGVLGTLPLTGQAEAFEALTGALRQTRTLSVWGPHGAGRSRVVRDAVFALQLECATAGQPIPTYRQVTELPPQVEQPTCVLHVLEADGIPLTELTALARASELAGRALWLVLERTSPLSEVASIEIPRLDERGLRQLLSAALATPDITDALVLQAQSVSAGLAGRLCRQLSAAWLDGAGPQDVLAAAAHAQHAADAGLTLSKAGREVGQYLAVAGGSLPRASLTLPDLLVAQGVHSLCTLGLCTRTGDGRLVLRSDVRKQLYRGLSQAERARLARSTLEPASDPRALAYLAHARGEPDQAEQLFARLGEAGLAEGDPGAVDALLSDALALWEPAPARLLTLQAEARRALGRYEQALTLLDGTEHPPAVLLRAEVLRLRGCAAPAQAVAESLLGAASHERAAEVRRGSHALLARLCLDRAELEACREHARLALECPGEPAALRAIEVLALADLMVGQLDAALARAHAGVVQAQARAARAAEARLHAVLGSVERARGQLSAAARHFARASELAAAAGEFHAAVSFTVNHATAQLDAGELGPALTNLRSGASGLLRLGRDRDTARVLANWVLAAQLLGDFAHALALAERLYEAATRAGDPWALAFGLLSSAEVLLERGERHGAEQRMQQLPDLAALSPVDRVTALSRGAGVWAELGQTERARTQLDQAEALLSTAPAATAEVALARAALARARGDIQACIDATEHAVAEAHARGEFPVLVLALTASAEAVQASGNAELAYLRYSELRALLDAAALTLTAAERALLRNVRGYRAALAAAPARASAARADVDARFGQLTQYIKRLTAETRLPRLYERILEAAVALSGAERGLLLRPDLQGHVRARAELGAASAQPIALASAAWSQSIVDRVLRTGQRLMSVNAAEDSLLVASSSVHALSLRSVLALPMRTHDAILGVIYLEDRLRPFAFGEAEIALLSDFADLASLTVTGVERLRRERRAVRRLSLTQARLAAQVQSQAIELRALKGAHDHVSDATGIVAESPAMREVLSLALRVAASDVPVLIRGESGTGKELVARAIHAHSPRKDRPFVSESCGAIPETLLESALFGHVRGAFTGADRRRVGLFEAASGGTLFLDEVAEMSPAMQTRLLRVLQEGEIRPVGGERTLHVDVRVLAATHRDLAAMVAEGSFREDLYYRLAVVDLRLPPLRERGSDVIPLVQHFIQKHAPDRAPRLERRAIERLMTGAWPGNVRQLENEVRRALVLGGDVLREEHFGIAQPGKDAGASGSELNLRSQVDELERRLIKRAFELAKGNQTRAAELLGVSRFGLQKMIKRLGLSNTG